MKRPHIVLAAGLFLTAHTLVMADTLLSDSDLSGAYTVRNYSKRVVCHDPSIFMDTITNGTPTSPQYYIYGSHLGRGRTSADVNYQSWDSFKAGEENTGTANSLFADLDGKLVNYSNAYARHAVTRVKNNEGVEVDFGNFNVHDWQAKGYTVRGNQWAADAIWNRKMQKWCLYMSLNGDHWCSSIVCFTSDSPEGPWVYQGPVVFSGFQGTYDHVGYNKTEDYKHTDLELAIGPQTSLPARYAKGSSWGSYWPNCIDPCVFYDEEGKLWMSYGSWSGGIFIFQLDEATGLRDYTEKYETRFSSGTDYRNCIEDPYFGRKIAGGWYNSGEASYIEYIGGYYYLFMSYGGLSGYGDYWATGYQMRVFRSDRPDGPYLDCTTADGRTATFTSAFTDFGSNTGTDYGVRLMSCYKWDTMAYAEIAQGHNSAIVDHTGRALVVYHTRQNNGNEGHSVRVHQLFQNQDGWLVAAPYEFDGETVTQSEIATKQLYTADEVAGDYQLIFHKYRQKSEVQEHELPINATLQADGTVTGKYTGTWQLVEGTSYLNITLKGPHTQNKEVTFNGVLTRQTIDYTNIPALCFTVLSSSDGTTATAAGTSGVQTRALAVWGSKADAKAAIKYTLDKTSLQTNISSDIVLPEGKLGANIAWTSSDENVITATGKVTGRGNATLTMTITKDGYSYTRDYNMTVDADATPVYYPECGPEDNSATWWTEFSQTYTIAKGKTAKFRFYNYNKGGENWENWVVVVTNGKDSHGGGGAEYFVLRADAYGWGNNNYNAANIQSNFDWNTFVSDMNGALVEVTITLNNYKVELNADITIQGGKTYYEKYWQSNVTANQIGVFFTVEGAHISEAGPNGEHLGIESVTIDSEADQDTIFDLYGRRHHELQPGFNVVGGRKVIVR